MRKAFVIILFVLILIPLSAGDHHDVSLSIGEESYKWPEMGMSFSYGVNIGLTNHLELDIWGTSELVPVPFASNIFRVELLWSLLGERSTASKIAGSALNTLIGIGGFYRTDNNGAGPLVSITPLTVGTPVSGRRERILRTALGYDAVNRELVVSFSLISIDYYLRGTWRDYSF